MICIDIDELSPCLQDTLSGEYVNTEVIRIKRLSILNRFNSKNGWCGPYKPADIPKIKMNLAELVKYAKSINKKVPELSDEEINRYISGATMDDVRNVRIIVPGVEYSN